ncbi:TonB-dependent receptor [Parapedomonas caeni]
MIDVTKWTARAVLATGCAAGALAAVSPATAWANAAADETAVSLEEITVTARKREENLQASPVSIAAFSAANLEARQVNNIADIGKFTPNMSFENGANIGGSSASVTMFIRGIGQTDFNLTIDPGVGLYVDGVYVSRSVGALLDTADVESVQVLRGPQGTLFGKNTIGGAVVITSKRPSDELEFSVEATTGRYDRFDAKTTINVPITDRFKIRASGSVQTRDGYVERLTDGEMMGNQKSLSGRLVAEFNATDNFTVTLAVDGNKRREQAAPPILLDTNEFGQFAGFNNFALNSCTPGSTSSVCYNDHWITGDKYKTWAGDDNESNMDLWGVSMTLDWDLDLLAVKSITAYRKLDSDFVLDIDASPLTISSSANEYSQKQFSQEFQFSGRALDDKLKWLLGLYYLKEKGTDRNYLSFSIADFLSGGKVDNDSYAAFSQVSYDLTDKLSVTLGARYTYEKKRFLPNQYIINDFTGGDLLMLSRCYIATTPTLPPNPLCAADPTLNPDGNRILPYVQVSTTAKEFTPAITVDYKVTDEVLAYASYSKGFKSGGFTQRVFPPESETPSFTPEFVNSYEVGLKTEWFDRRLRLNGAAFYTDYSDLQIVVNEGIAPKVRNAGKARIKGFELEYEVAVAEGIRWSGGAGYTDAYYLEVPAIASPVTVASKLPNAPKWTATSGLSADVWTTEAGTLSLRGDWSYKGGHYKDAVNSAALYQKGVSLFNASATFTAADEHWSATFGATNLTNKKYLLSGYQDLAAASAVEGTFSRPREWYLKLKYQY